MLLANEAITIVRHIKDPEGDAYRCLPCVGSWHQSSKAAVIAGGLQSARLVRCRIPVQRGSELAAALGAVRPGDRLFRGEMKTCTGQQFAALGRTEGGAVVLDIHDNTRGALSHFYLEGAV